VAVKWALKGEPFRVTALALLRDALKGRVKLIAPPDFISEVDSAVRKRVYEGRLLAAEARKAYAYLNLVPVRVVDVPGMRQRARDLAEQFNQRTVYDAMYTALAELRGCDYWTADTTYYEAVRGRLRFVKFLPHYT
jgi:predicted nucleic acid-binding protein